MRAMNRLLRGDLTELSHRWRSHIIVTIGTTPIVIHWVRGRYHSSRRHDFGRSDRGWSQMGSIPTFTDGAIPERNVRVFRS